MMRDANIYKVDDCSSCYVHCHYYDDTENTKTQEGRKGYEKGGLWALEPLAVSLGVCTCLSLGRWHLLCAARFVLLEYLSEGGLENARIENSANLLVANIPSLNLDQD